MASIRVLLWLDSVRENLASGQLDEYPIGVFKRPKIGLSSILLTASAEQYVLQLSGIFAETDLRKRKSINVKHVGQFGIEPDK